MNIIKSLKLRLKYICGIMIPLPVKKLEVYYMSGIKICITNGDRNEWLTLPAGHSEADKAFRKIGAEEGTYQISDCESGFGEKLDEMITGADPDIANYLAVRLSGLSSGHIELLEVMMEHLSDVLSCIERVIDFPDNTGVYEIYRNVHNSKDLALYYINESGQIQIPEEWVEGIDLKKFGKHLEKHESGHYTKYGYLIATGLDWIPCFEGSGEVPSEYRLTKNHA